MSLIAGVIDSTTNYVEHPEVVADRIERVARVVGHPHRIMAGTDCGFETTSGMGHVAEELVWEKLRRSPAPPSPRIGCSDESHYGRQVSLRVKRYPSRTPSASGRFLVAPSNNLAL
jgi:hypothetical protein